MIGDCPDCNGKLSSEAASCPHCGYIVKKPVETTQQLTQLTPKNTGSGSVLFLGWLSAVAGIIPAYSVIRSIASGVDLAGAAYRKPITIGVWVFAGIAPFAWLLSFFSPNPVLRRRVALTGGLAMSLWFASMIPGLYTETEITASVQQPVAVPGTPAPTSTAAPSPEPVVSPREPEVQRVKVEPAISVEDGARLCDFVLAYMRERLRATLQAGVSEYTSKKLYNEYQVRVNGRLENPTNLTIDSVAIEIDFFRSGGTAVGRSAEEILFTVGPKSRQSFDYQNLSPVHYETVKVRIGQVICIALAKNAREVVSEAIKTFPSHNYEALLRELRVALESDGNPAPVAQSKTRPGAEKPEAQSGRSPELTPQARFKEAAELHKQGQYSASIPLFEKVFAEDTRSQLGYLSAYNIACGYAMLGKQGEALTWLEASVQNGFKDVEHMKRDEDLKSLRESPRYKHLIGE